MEKSTKGQISIDMIFAILAILLLAGGFAAVSSDLAKTQEKITIRQELEKTALNISNAIIYAKALEGTTFEIKINHEKLSYEKETANQIITINKNEVIVAEMITKENISITEKTDKPDWMEVISSKNQTVIKNA